MISRELAEQVGTVLPWRPASGDRFLVPDRDLDDQVFVVSEMAIDVGHYPTGPEMRFNGTVEWALDSLPKSEAVWLPREDQLRDALGSRFLRLESVATDDLPGWAVVVAGPDGHEERHVDTDVECAYARAVLALLGR